MFRYKRYYPSKRGRYYSFGRYYGKYSRRGTVARAAAGAAAAKRSDKTETYSCTVNGILQVGLVANQNLSTVAKIAPYSGGVRASGVVDDERNLVHGGAVNDRGFRMKCASYDEVKLDSIKITIIPAQFFSDNAVTMTMCTFWDRKASPKECGFQGGGDWMANGSVPTSLEIFNNEGTIKSQISHNQIYGYKRYCNASSILEKGGYTDSSIYYNPTPGQSPTDWMYLDAWLRNPMNFSPCLYFMIYCPATFTVNRILNYSYKVEYTFTFRNPKSDLDYFLEIESPGYINEEADPDNIADPNSRSAKSRAAAVLAEPGTLLADIQRNYALRAVKTMDTSTAFRTINDLFIKPEIKKDIEKKDEIKEEPMDIEVDQEKS